MCRWWFAALALISTLSGCGVALPAPTATRLPTPTAPLVLPTQPLPTPTREDQGKMDPKLAGLVAQARADLAKRLGAAADAIALHKAEARDWPDTALGCPEPGKMYAQVITPGFVVVLESAGREYSYHSDGARIFWCEK